MKVHLVLIIATLRSFAAADRVKQCCTNGSEFVRGRYLRCTNGESLTLNCTYGAYALDPILAEDKEEFQNLSDGTSILIDEYSLDEYCLAQITDNISSIPRTIAYVCFEPNPDRFLWLFMIVMVVSVPFLLITILVYTIIPSLRDLNGKCIIGYVCSLTISFTSMISRYYMPEVSFEHCSFRGAVLYFSTMSTFSWLNLVIFNVWRSIRNKMYYISDKKLFLLFLIWSIGLPLILCGIILLLHVLPESHFTGHFSNFDCWSTGSSKFWILLYIPMSTMIIFNIVMFVHCCWILWVGYRDPSQDRIRALRLKCMFILRLFLLSGVPWIFDVISGTFKNVEELTYLWLFFDCVNCAQGIVIFLLLIVFHKRVLRAIYEYHLCGIKWPESWGQYESDSVAVSDIDKVAMEQMKNTET